MSANRNVTCQVCKQDIQVRSSMAYQTLYNHLKTHEEVTESISLYKIA